MDSRTNGVPKPNGKVPNLPPVRFLEDDEWHSYFDSITQREFQISGEEFVRRLRAGELGNPDDNPKVIRIAMLIPNDW